jgi:hypothetical protein
VRGTRDDSLLCSVGRESCSFSIQSIPIPIQVATINDTATTTFSSSKIPPFMISMHVATITDTIATTLSSLCFQFAVPVSLPKAPSITNPFPAKYKNVLASRGGFFHDLMQHSPTANFLTPVCTTNSLTSVDTPKIESLHSYESLTPALCRHKKGKNDLRLEVLAPEVGFHETWPQATPRSQRLPLERELKRRAVTSIARHAKETSPKSSLFLG